MSWTTSSETNDTYPAVLVFLWLLLSQERKDTDGKAELDLEDKKVIRSVLNSGKQVIGTVWAKWIYVDLINPNIL